MSTHYDYIFTGAGAAGLSLLTRMIDSGKFRDKQILVIDQSAKNINDRTWCFWEAGNGFFEEIISYRYSNLWFYGKGYAAMNDISPYQYKLLRGIDFYTYCMDKINAASNVTWLEQKVDAIDSGEQMATVRSNGISYTAEYLFNSILFQQPSLGADQYWLLQHFKGWVIETAQPVFDTAAATLMDFRVSQEYGTTFVYVMPFAPNKALIEYTLFTPSLLEPKQYEEGLHQYIANFLHITDYRITEEEYGVIPMTNYAFPKYQNRIVHIGTAGGQTKASSGYTFQFIQRESVRIIDALDRTGTPFYEVPVALKRFDFYDSTLLNILYHNKLEGSRIFTELFQKNKMTEVLQFLDNDTTILQELRLISVLPKGAFMKAAMEQLF